MASAELIKLYNQILSTEVNGIVQLPLVNSLIDLAKVSINEEDDIGTALKITSTAKRYCVRLMQAQNLTFRQVDEYCIENKIEIPELQTYWNAVLEETPYLFESFIAYMEKNRPYPKKFYEPRKYTKDGKESLKIVARELQNLAGRKYKFLGVSLPARTGKALAYDTPVLTRNGWKNHGDLTIRDEVIGFDGEYKKILAIHNPCKMEYKVTFSDKEEIVCHGNHEWVVFDRYKNEVVTLETKEMIGKEIDNDGHRRFSMPISEKFRGDERELIVDPYTLGAWLGDGRNNNPDICGDKNDYAIVDKILHNGYELAWDTVNKVTGVVYYGFRNLRQQLQTYGMCHSRRRVDKFIPDDYLNSSREQRLELLAGLLDTDGTLRKSEHRYTFSTAEETLKDSFVSLVNGLGWRTSVVKYAPKTSSSGITGRRCTYAISFNPDEFIPCVLERKQLHEYSKQHRVTIDSITPIEDEVYGNCITVEDGIYRVGRTLKPTHNSTICIFYLCWQGLRRPNSHSAMGGHAGTLVKGFYKELLNLMTSTEYTFAEIYEHLHPNHTLICDKSAEDFTITLDLPDRFATITCRGIDATWTGAVDVSKDGLLYVDDLVRDRQHSLSPTRMEETFQEYLNKMVDRKNDGAQELMVGTLWNVLDPLERLRKINENNPDYKFIRVPALDDKDESNFDYEYNGFSTEYYKEMRQRLDNAEWQAKYQQQPFVREGLLFASNELKYFDGLVKIDDIARVYSVTDTAVGGGDSVSAPICYEMKDGRKLICKWIYDKRTVAFTVPRVINTYKEHSVTVARVEKNGVGSLWLDNAQKYIKENNIFGVKLIPVLAPNRMSKEDKIKGYSDTIKMNYTFLAPNITKPQEIPEGYLFFERDADYTNAMNEMAMYTSDGKNPHDDAPDSMSQLAIMDEKQSNGTVTVVHNPFRGGY